MEDDTEFTSGRDEIYPGAAGDIPMTFDEYGNVIPVAGEAGGGNRNIPGGGGTNPITYGGAGFGAGQVLGGEAARRQQEILTGSQYSANMPPPGYRPGFGPEYLYFGDPRYEDYAALLPGVYGTGYQPPGVPAPAPGAPAPVVPTPTPTPTPTPVGGVDPVTGLPLYTGGDLSFSQADIDRAMELIISGQYDINSLASQLGVPQETAYNIYNQYLSDTYGVGAFDPNRQYEDQALQDLAQQYYGVANQYGYSPEQLSRIFGTPLDQTRSYLSQQYLGGIPVDQDYTADEAQQVYDLYKSGRMGVTGIANYFGIPESEALNILNSIEGSGGQASSVIGSQQDIDRNSLISEMRSLFPNIEMGNLTPEQKLTVRELINKGLYGSLSMEDARSIFGDLSDEFTEDDAALIENKVKGSLPLSDIQADGDYSQSEIDQVYSLYTSGKVSAQDISDYFNIPVSEVNTALSDIAQSRRQVAAGGVGSTTVPAEDVRNTARSSGAVISQDDTEGQGVNPITTAMDLYSSGVEIPADQIRETLEYAQARGISYAQLDQMFGAPAGSAQDAAAALGMAASAGGIVGMAKGGKFPDLSGDGEVTQEDILIGRGVIEKADGGLLDKLSKLDRDLKEDREQRQAERRERGRKVSDYIPYPSFLGGDVYGALENIMYDAGAGIAGLFEKEEEPKPQGGALLTETESYLEAQRILGDADSSDRDKAFARGTLETLKPEQQGGNMDMNSYSEMMQQVDKILGATRNMQEGGYIDRDQLDSLISMTRDAILGDAENADQIIQAFISVFGQEAFEQLRDQVLQSQVPDAQTEGIIEGSGGGMDDEVMGMIGNQQGVAVSPGEYIIPADVVSSLGDGSSDAGADKLDRMLDDVRMAKTGRTIQPGKIDDGVMPA
jgi:hypothetical protein